MTKAYKPGFEALLPIHPDPEPTPCNAQGCRERWATHIFTAGGVTKHFCFAHRSQGQAHLTGAKR